MPGSLTICQVHPLSEITNAVETLSQVMNSDHMDDMVGHDQSAQFGLGVVAI